MNNFEKYKNSVNKIQIREDIVKSAILESRKYRKNSKIKNGKKVKMGIIGRTIITAITLMSASAASYAGYTAITGKDPLQIFPKKSTVALEGEINTIDSLEVSGIENNGINYKIDIPSDFIISKDGNADIFKLKVDENVETEEKIPDVYMKITVIDSSEVKNKINEITTEMKKYFSQEFETVEYYSDETKIGLNELDSKEYTVNKGWKWNSELSKYYIVKVNDQKYMIIENTFYKEASEGWGSAMKQIVTESLEILNI